MEATCEYVKEVEGTVVCSRCSTNKPHAGKKGKPKDRDRVFDHFVTNQDFFEANEFTVRKVWAHTAGALPMPGFRVKMAFEELVYQKVVEVDGHWESQRYPYDDFRTYRVLWPHLGAISPEEEQRLKEEAAKLRDEASETRSLITGKPWPAKDPNDIFGGFIIEEEKHVDKPDA